MACFADIKRVKFFGERQTVAGTDRTQIINQIISSYRGDLKTPKDYYALKAKLETLKDDELQAELSKCLLGSYKAPWDMGLSVEQNKDVVVPYILPEQPAETPKKELSPQEKLQEQIKQDLLDCGIFVSKYNTPTLELLTQIYQEAPKNGNRTYKDFVQKFQDIVFEYKDKPVKNPDELRKKLLCELNLDFYPSYPQDRKKVEEMRLQNYTAQTISNIYSFLADSYEELFNRGSLTADASASLKELATGVSVQDYIQSLKQNAQNFSNLSPEKMNYADFKKNFKAVFGVEYNEKAVQELMQYCSENPQLDILKDKDFKEKFKNLFGDTVDFSKIKNMGIASKWGDIALTLAMFTVIHNTKPMINLKSKTQAFNSALGMGEKRNEILTRFVTGAASMGTYTASAGALDNLITGTPANSDKWAELPKEVLASLPFGGFAGALDAIAVSPVLQKMIPDGVKAAQSALASGTECSGTDFLKILYNSTTKQKLINLAAFLGRGVYTTGVYGAGNTVYGVTADLITNGTQNISKGEFLNYLGANFKEHFKGMGEYEIMSLVQMFGAGRLGAMNSKGLNKTLKMPEFKNLDNITVKMETVDGKQMYKVKVAGSADGKTKPVEKYTESFEDIVNLFHTIALADVQMANNTSPQTETNPTTPSLLFKPKATATEPTADKPETPKSPANSPEKPLQQEKPETAESKPKRKRHFHLRTDKARKKYLKREQAIIERLKAEGKFTKNEIMDIRDCICPELIDFVEKFIFSDLFSKQEALDIVKNQNFLVSTGKIEDYVQLLDNHDFVEYAKKFDKSKVPAVANFSGDRYLYFLKYHFELGHTDLTPEMLTFQGNLTDYVTKNPIDSYGMSKLLTEYPNTNRNVGSMPDNWFTGLPQNEIPDIKQKVLNCIDDLILSNDWQTFQNKLSGILGKNITTNYVGGGVSADCYKISVENGETVCLKVFHNHKGLDLSYEGRTYEPQMGLFLNENSNKYVHMYFGKVSAKGQRGGYLVTQYLDENTVPIIGQENPNFGVYYTDNKPENYKNGLRIDFGTTEVLDINTASPEKIKAAQRAEDLDKLLNKYGQNKP